MLRAKGFSLGKLPALITVENKNLGDINTDFAARPFFLHCLVAFEKISQKGLSSFPSGDSELYYKAILSHSEPARVPAGIKTSDLKRFLEGSDSEANDTESERDGDIVLPLLTRQRKKRSPKAVQPAGGAKRPRLQPPAPLSDTESAFGGEWQGSSNGMHGSGRTLHASSGNFFIEGQNVLIERRIGRGDNRNYCRCMVVCPNSNHCLPGSSRTDCSRRRNFDLDNNRHSIQQCLGFLGVWLRASHRLRTHQEHKGFVPSAASVQDYIESGNVQERHINAVVNS